MKTGLAKYRAVSMLADVEWTKKGIPIAIAALVAGGVGVWVGLRPWSYYGWEIAWTWPFMLVIGLAVFLFARRRPLPAIERGHTERAAAHLCVAFAGIATSLASGAQIWDAGQCVVGDTMSVRVDTVDEVYHRSRQSGTRGHTDYDITYTYGGQSYSGTTGEYVYPGDDVDVVRPGGPVCDDAGGPTIYLVALGPLPIVAGGWWAGRLAGAARQRRRSDDEPQIPGIEVLD